MIIIKVIETPRGSVSIGVYDTTSCVPTLVAYEGIELSAYIAKARAGDTHKADVLDCLQINWQRDRALPVHAREKLRQKLNHALAIKWMGRIYNISTRCRYLLTAYLYQDNATTAGITTLLRGGQ